MMGNTIVMVVRYWCTPDWGKNFESEKKVVPLTIMTWEKMAKRIFSPSFAMKLDCENYIRIVARKIIPYLLSSLYKGI